MAMPPKHSEIEQALGEPLADLISARRAAGVSWRLIAVEITRRTGIDVAGETIRIWTAGVPPVLAPAAESAERGAA